MRPLKGISSSLLASLPRRWIRFALALWREFQDDRILDGAAVIAFYSMFAVFPAAIVALTLQPYLGIPHLQQAIVDLLHQVLPKQSADLFNRSVHYGATHGRRGVVTFGLAFAVWSGSAGVASFMDQLNVIHDVPERRPYWKARAISILLLFVFSVLQIVSLSLVIFGGDVQSWAASFLGLSEPLLIFFMAVRWFIFSAALLLGLAIGYHVGPDIPVKFHFFSPGSVTAASLIALCSYGLRFYVAKVGSYSAMYGSLAAIIILMMWMFMTSIALLLGCEIDTVLREFRSTAPEPGEPRP